jgi:hypothetical protein
MNPISTINNKISFCPLKFLLQLLIPQSIVWFGIPADGLKRQKLVVYNILNENTNNYDRR